MGRKRIYPKVNGNWNYALITPNNEYYFGCSGQQECHDRWHVDYYMKGSFRKYIIKYGWQNIKKVVIADGLTKDQAVMLEGMLIKAGKELGICVNDNNSGYVTRDMKLYEAHRREKPERKKYLKEWVDENRDHVNEYQNQWYHAHKDEINARRREKYYQSKSN